MADVSAAREARRRKLLENREDRMNRLLGKSSDSHNGPQQNQELLEQARNTLPDETELCLSKEEMNLTSAETYSIHDVSSVADAQITSNICQETVSESPSRSAARATNMQALSSMRSSLTRSAGSGIHQGSHRPVTANPELLKILDRMRVGGCVLVAFVTSWSLALGLGILFLEFVLLPFLLLEGFLLYFQTTYMKDIQLPHKSSTVSSALMLCGIRQEAVTIYNKLMGYIYAATEDFAIYLFSFIVFSSFIGVGG